MSETPVRSIEAVYAEMLGDKLQNIAGRLRRLAEVTESEAGRIGTVGKPSGSATYASVASRVQHDILWGLANLHLDGLTDTAQQADEYRVGGQ